MDGKLIGQFPGHTNRISQLCPIEGSASTFYSVSEDGLLITWDNRLKQPCHKIIAGVPLCSIGYNAEENLLAAGTEGKVFVWDMTGKRKGLYEDIHTEEVSGVIFHPVTKSLYSSSYDGLISEFNCTLGETEDDAYISGINLEQPISKFGFFGADSNSYYAISTNETLFIGNLINDNFITFPSNFRELLSDMAQTTISSLIDCKYLKRSDQLLLFTSSLSGRVNIFQVRNFDVTLIAGLPENGHTDLVRTITMTPNREFYITGGDDGQLCVWKKDAENTTTPDQLKIVRPKVHCKNFSPY